MKQKSFCANDLANQFILKHSNTVYRLAYSLVKNRYDAEDIYQEVFIKYLLTHPRFESEEHEKAWILRVTINLCKNHWKTAWRRKVTTLSEYEQISEELKSDELELIEQVKQLPQKYRAVIHLFYYEDMSIEEIAIALRQKPSTVRTRLTRARAKLKQMLKEEI